MGNCWSDRQEAFHGKKSNLGLMQLLAGLRDDEAAAFCKVSVWTYRRWIRGQPNPTGLRLMAIRAGYFPWPGWNGWFMLSGKLISPDWADFAATPGELNALPLHLERLKVLTVELQQLREAYERLQGSITGQSYPVVAELPRSQLR